MAGLCLWVYSTLFLCFCLRHHRHTGGAFRRQKAGVAVVLQIGNGYYFCSKLWLCSNGPAVTEQGVCLLLGSGIAMQQRVVGRRLQHVRVTLWRGGEWRPLVSLRQLAGVLGQRVIGQQHGLEMIARRIQTSRARLDNPGKPIGVFMLCGTSGVGKTETALALAEALYGGEQNVITINMSEFQEAHTVSTLKGAPPGYVGYGEGGILTEAVRRRPYSVVLLDEVEKAHPDVHEIFFQVFDKGWMEDGEGRMIDFKNTIILLTTNAGSELVMGMCRDPELLPEPNALADALKAPLMKVFPPALLGRIVTIPYYPLSPDMMKKIVRLQLGRIKKRVETNHGVPFEYSEAVVDQVVARCQDPESGGRVIDAILTNTVLPTISVEYLQRLAAGGEIKRVALDVKDSDFTYAFD